MGRILLVSKPFGVICQFSRDCVHQTIGDYIAIPDFYPAWRLDTNSDGLLVLTIRKGKRRQMWRMSTAIGLPMLSPIPVHRIGESTLSGLEQGKWQFESP
jgi:16S rRNA U516 pseudouridylate synthase RsuA-like enzyme